MLQVLLLFLLSFNIVVGTLDNPDLDLEFLYKEGVNHYLDNRWDLCIKNMELAIQDWHWWSDNIVRCRKECQNSSDSVELLGSGLSLTEESFERMIHNTLCLVQCKKEVFGLDRMDKIPSLDVLNVFEKRKPYDYLQLCYFQMKRYKEAADAALTVFTAQPEHEIMKNNLEIYTKEEGINQEDLVDREQKIFSIKYFAGDTSYQNKNYEETVRNMEGALSLFWDEYEKCRLMCESPFDQGWFPDFVSSVSNHFTYVLRCKSKCHKKLATFYGKEIEDLVPSMYNYLQFAYYKLDNVKKATEAVGSYLFIMPDDAVQLRNKQYYSSMEGVTDEMFAPRKEAVDYLSKIEYEARLLHFIDTKFVDFNENKLNSEEFQKDDSTILDSLTSVISDILTAKNNKFDDELPKNEL